MFKKLSFNKKNFFYFVILFSIIILFLLLQKRVNKITNFAVEKYSQIKNRSLKKYLKSNENLIEKHCLADEDVVEYYLSIYKDIIKILYELDKKNIIKTASRKKIYKLLKQANMKEVYNEIKKLNLNQINSTNLSDKNMLLALSGELVFYDFKIIDDFIKKAISLNQFNVELYLRQAKFYNKTCKIDESINILLKLSGISANIGNFNRLYEIYQMIGNNYFIQRDYNNSLLYYVNAMSYVDYNTNNNVGKFKILNKIGDIMVIKGNIFESINFYKYALGKTSKITKEEKINTILKLSKAYYTYGNYDNGLKFANMAEKFSITINNNYLLSKAKLMKCLNYEYLSKEEIGKEECKKAEELALLFAKNNSNTFEIAEYFFYMYNFLAYLKNFDKAEKYIDIALKFSEYNIYKKISILEKKAHLYTYNEDKIEETTKIFDELEKLYTKANIKNFLIKNVLKGYILNFKNRNLTKNIYYDKAEEESQNYKIYLVVLYSYKADFYQSKNDKVLAKFYFTKSLETARQTYKYDHHYINYLNERINNLENN